MYKWLHSLSRSCRQREANEWDRYYNETRVCKMQKSPARRHMVEASKQPIKLGIEALS